jgi:hypothetical protein
MERLRAIYLMHVDRPNASKPGAACAVRQLIGPPIVITKSDGSTPISLAEARTWVTLADVAGSVKFT